MSWCFKWVVEWDRKSYLGPAEIELASAKVLSIKQTAQTLSTEQGFLWNKMIFCVFWGFFFVLTTAKEFSSMVRNRTLLNI